MSKNKGAVSELFEKLWSGEITTEKMGPMSQLLGLEEVMPGVAFVSSMANVSAIETEAGLVLIDSGSFLLAENIHRQIREWSSLPLHTIIYTHGHTDHCFGIQYWEQDQIQKKSGQKITVVAHELVAKRFDRYKNFNGYNQSINNRQFKVKINFPTEFRYPDITYRDSMKLTIGNILFELNHAQGETDDATWVNIPSKNLICCGDLFIWCVPNCGNPQKVQRYPAEWALALRNMASKNASYLFPGHGTFIIGKDRVEEALLKPAELLEYLLKETTILMNQGRTLNEIICSVKVPEELLKRPYLKPIYDEPEFIIRNIWRLYGGWYDGNPANLKPGSEIELSKEVSSLIGSKKLIERCKLLLEADKLVLASHLIQFAFQADPKNPEILELKSQIFKKRSTNESSLMAKNIFLSASKL